MIRPLLTAFMFLPSVVFADDVAVIIGNQDYRHTVELDGGRDAVGLADHFEEMGYKVQIARNADRADFGEIFEALLDRHEGFDRIAIVYAGHVLNNGSDSFLTPVDLEKPSLKNISRNAVSVERLLDILGDHAGGAALFVASGATDAGFFSNSSVGFEDAEGLKQGLSKLDIPQGVLVVSGEPDDLLPAIKDDFMTAGSIAEAVENNSDLEAAGYISVFSSLTSATASSADVSKEAMEAAYWDIAVTSPSEANYRQYITRYPNGLFVEEAKASLDAILTSEPELTKEQLAEQDLALNREARRDIQRTLTLLKFDPKGVDGLFGPATRRAITSWQRIEGFEPSGYLSASQLRLLRAQGQQRAKELAAEAERKAEEERLRDIAFWKKTGQSGLEADLRIYLREFPDGLYSQEAAEALAGFERERARNADSQEQGHWAWAESTNTAEAYEDYLRSYPRGVFAEQAQERIAELQENTERKKLLAKAKERENALGLNKATWRLIESRLESMELNPGKVDGKVDKQTRKAIRIYQRNNELPVTGFLDAQSISRLILFIKL